METAGEGGGGQMLILRAKSVFPFGHQRLPLEEKFEQRWLTERHRRCGELFVFGNGWLR
jgi:hypothetical protein